MLQHDARGVPTAIVSPDGSARQINLPQEGPGAYGVTTEVSGPGEYRVLFQQGSREEVVRLAKHKGGHHYQYIEAGVWELLPIGPSTRDDDSRRLGRWVANVDGLIWRPRAA